jgi:hypothetical protein
MKNRLLPYFHANVLQPADLRLARERNRNGLNMNPGFRNANSPFITRDFAQR